MTKTPGDFNKDDVMSKSTEEINIEASRKITVPKFCATRWSARLDILWALERIAAASTGNAKTEVEGYAHTC